MKKLSLKHTYNQVIVSFPVLTFTPVDVKYIETSLTNRYRFYNLTTKVYDNDRIELKWSIQPRNKKTIYIDISRYAIGLLDGMTFSKIK